MKIIKFTIMEIGNYSTCKSTSEYKLFLKCIKICFETNPIDKKQTNWWKKALGEKKKKIIKS